MNTTFIDVTDNAEKLVTRVPGWRVAVEQRVWDRFVAVPTGCVGESEGTRLWDLLFFLFDELRRVPELGEGPVDHIVFRVRGFHNEVVRPRPGKRTQPNRELLGAVVSVGPN